MTQPIAALNPLTVRLASPSRDRTSRLADFFRYHGIWAPGVRLFRAVGFRSKAALIALTFALPLAVLAYSYFTDKAAAIDFSARERVGVAYLREAMPVLTALQRQRRLAVQAVVQRRAADEMPQVRAELEQALARLAAAETAYGTVLSTGKAHAALIQAIKSLAPAKGLEATIEAHNALADAAIELFGAATDNSNLTLDPDIDTYYLMDGSLFALPVLSESEARLRDMAWARAAGAPTDEAFQRMLTTERVVSLQNERRMSAAVDKVAAVHPDAPRALGVAEFRNKLHHFTDVTRQGDVAPDAVARAALESLEDLSRVQERMMKQLDELLGVRVDGLNRARLITGGVLVAGLLLALYFFLSFQKVLDGGLREVAYHIDAMRDGDLTTQPRAWGADEPAKLMQTLVSMQQSLRRIVSQVRHASDTIVHATTEIASGAADLSARTEQSAATLEETASAMEQISATVRRNEHVVEEAARIANANAQAAQHGGEIIGEVVQTMKLINDSSSRIGDIIGTIDGIAFQTNILALNAAVEAARAGEQGRGFAVVASEVRALAQRSSSAAREIKDLITSSVGQVEGGVRVVRRAGDTIGELVESSQRVRQLLSEVSTAAREQSVGIAQSAQAVQALDNATQQNAALVEETAAAAGSLQDQANGLVAEVAQFRLPGAG